MKTLEELYEQIRTNEELKETFVAALKENTVEDFLKANDCEGSMEDVMKFMDSKKSGEITDDDLDKVAGGLCSILDKKTFTCCGC